MNGNSITVVGNLTRDPELKFVSNGQALLRVSVADNHGWKGKDSGEWETKTSFIDCKAWGSIAEHASESLAKGDRVIIVGRIDQESWETEDGDKRSKLVIDIDSIGPDLRFATAEVTKAESGSGNRPQRDSGGGAKRGTKRAPEPTYEDDEEPF